MKQAIDMKLPPLSQYYKDGKLVIDIAKTETVGNGMYRKDLDDLGLEKQTKKPKTETFLNLPRKIVWDMPSPRYTIL